MRPWRCWLGHKWKEYSAGFYIIRYRGVELTPPHYYASGGYPRWRQCQRKGCGLVQDTHLNY